MTRKERYEDRRRRGACVDCDRRPARRGRVRCSGCARKASQRTQSWQRRNRRCEAEVRKRRMESLYWSNPHVFRAATNTLRLNKKLNGICRDCPRPSLEDNVRCRRCRKRDLARQRASAARLRAKRVAAQRHEERRILWSRQLDEMLAAPRGRILRAGRLLDWFSLSELVEAMGGGDERERNTIAKTLERLTKAGRFQRRRIARLFSAHGARWEYLIAKPGLDELQALTTRRPA